MVNFCKAGVVNWVMVMGMRAVLRVSEMDGKTCARHVTCLC